MNRWKIIPWAVIALMVISLWVHGRQFSMLVSERNRAEARAERWEHWANTWENRATNAAAQCKEAQRLAWELVAQRDKTFELLRECEQSKTTKQP